MKTSLKLSWFILLLVFGWQVYLSAGTKSERDYQDEWCPGLTEYILPDRTRVDCLTGYYAIEIDFGPKWAEAIGQSLYYASQTDKQPGVLLIIESPTDCRYLVRFLLTIRKHGLPIQLWTTPIQCFAEP